MNQRETPLSLSLIQGKTGSLFEGVKAKGGEDAAKDESFAASHGWFACFKQRANLYSLKLSGEAASADKKAAEEFPFTLKKIIDANGYTPNKSSTSIKLACSGKRCQQGRTIA